MIIGILIGIAFAILLIGSFTDFKIREVPDWVNYSGIVAGLGIRFLYSAFTFDWSYIIAGLLGFGVFFGIALVMFYLGQWGGGDSKMLMGLGALLGLEIRPDGMLISFFINMLFVGAAFGVFWSLYLAVKERKKFKTQIKKTIKTENYKKAKYAIYVLVIVFIITSFFFHSLIATALLSGAFIILLVFYVWVFMISVEKISMLKQVPVENLTEGDWIVKNVVIEGKKICGPKDLGISKQQIAKLLKLKKKGKIKKILIKEGMPFIPAFLIAFAITVFFGNMVLYFI